LEKKLGAAPYLVPYKEKKNNEEFYNLFFAILGQVEWKR
jgi:hypothetical protein